MAGRFFLLVSPALLFSGCVVETAGPTQHDFRVFELDKSETLRVNLKMGAGHVKVASGGTQNLARADFTYNIPSWKPYVRYSSMAGHGDLTIEQPGSGHSHVGANRYEWDLRLNREVPVDLRVNFGAGEADLDVGGLALKSVEIDMGVGHLNLNLRGEPKHSYDVRIRGGVGEATVRLPSDVGISAQAEGGIGEINATGLRREGHHYFNDAYEHSKVTIHLDIRGGVGAIRLISD
jgi:N-terminal domain of toast_rack, DUF2154